MWYNKIKGIDAFFFSIGNFEFSQENRINILKGIKL